MAAILAQLQLVLLMLTTLFSDSGVRLFSVSGDRGEAPYDVVFDASSLVDARKPDRLIFDFGDGNTMVTTIAKINHRYQNPGNYEAQLTYQKIKIDKNGKIKVLTSQSAGKVKITVLEKPNVNPVANLNCQALGHPNYLKVTCDGSHSLDEDGQIVSFKLSFGDQSEELVVLKENFPITYTYTTGGEKTIGLKVTDNKGGEDYKEVVVNVIENTAPVANFSCSKVGILKVHCESTSSDNEEEISNFAWSLEDGAVYNTASFDHTFNLRYEDLGKSSQEIKLSVTDSGGLTHSVTKNVEVDLEPINLPPRGYVKVYMDQTTIDLRSFVIATQFPLRSGFYQIFNEQGLLLHTIPLADFYQNTSTKIDLGSFGNYRVVLKVKDWRDQEITISRNLTLVEDTSILRPFIGFRAIQVKPRTLYLNLNPSFDFDENFAIKEFVVKLGNEKIITLKNETFFNYEFLNVGTYEISVTAKTNHGTERTETFNFTATYTDYGFATPDPTFNYRIYSFANNVSFYNEKSGSANGEIISYQWDFGDGTTATGESAAHFYEPGTYIVSLTIVDSAGKSATQRQKINILQTDDDLATNIRCDLNLPYVDIEQKCEIYALDRLNDISRVRVVWGDGTVYSLPIPAPYDPRQGLYYPVKKYSAEGDYPVRLIVNTNRGAFEVKDTSLSLALRSPVASLQCFVNNLMVYCDGLASFDPKGNSQNYPLVYEFDLGNGEVITSSTGLVNFNYSEPGLYEVRLIVTDIYGISSTATTFVQALRPPNQLPSSIANCLSDKPLTIGCNAGPSFDPDGNIVKARYEFSDGSVYEFDKDFHFEHRFDSAGEKTLRLTVFDNDGGSSESIFNWEVLQNNPPQIFIGCHSPKPRNLKCYSNVHETDRGDYVDRVVWTVGIESVQSFVGYEFSADFDFSGTIQVKAEAFDSIGGKVEVVNNFQIQENLAPVAFLQCFSGYPRNLNCTSYSYDPNGDSFSQEWFLNDQLISNTKYFDLNNAPEGMNRLVLKLRDSFGFITELEQSVFVEFTINPKIEATCKEIHDLSISCYAKNMLLEDSLIQELRWIVNGNYVSSGNSLNYKSDSEEILTVELDIVSSSLVTTRMLIGQYTPFYEFLNSIYCKEYIEEVHCLGENFNNDDGINYKWSFDGQEFQSSNVVFAVNPNEDSGKIINLEIRDSRGNIENLSYTLDLNNDLYHYYVPDTFEIFTEEGQLFVDKEKNLKIKNLKNTNFRIFSGSLNGEIFNHEKVLSSDLNYAVIDIKPIEGKNELELEFFDSENKKRHAKIEFFSGTKNVNFSTNTINSYRVTVNVVDEREVVGSLDFSGENFVLKYVPSQLLLLTVEGQSEFGASLLRPIEVNKDITLSPFDGEVTANDYSEEESTSNVGHTMNNGASVSSLKSGDYLHIVKWSKPSGEVSSGMLSFGYSLVSGKDALAVVILKNLNTNEKVERIIYADGFSKVFSSVDELNKYIENIGFKNADDKIIFDIKIFHHEKDVENTSFLNTVIDKLIRRVHANVALESSAIRYLPSEVKYIQKIELRSHVADVNFEEDDIRSYEPTKTESLSIGRYHKLINWKEHDKGIYNKILRTNNNALGANDHKESNPLRIVYDSGTVKMSYVEFQILQRNEIGAVEDVVYSQRVNLKQEEGRNFVDFYLKSQHAIDWRKFINTNETSRLVTVQFRFVSMANEVQLVQMDLVPLFLTYSNIPDFDEQGLSCNNAEIFSYSLRDCMFGLDSWLSPVFLKYVSENYFRMNGDDYVFKFGDVSRMNGGIFYEHKGHGNGLELDFKILDRNPAKKDFYANRRDALYERKLAKQLINFVWNKSDRINNMYLTVAEDSNFEREMEMTCLPDGRMMYVRDIKQIDYDIDVVNFMENHAHHGHWDFLESKRTRKLAPPVFGRYRIELSKTENYKFRVFDNYLNDYINPKTHVLSISANNTVLAPSEPEPRYLDGDWVNVNRLIKFVNGEYDLTNALEGVSYKNKLPLISDEEWNYHGSDSIKMRVVDIGNQSRGCSESEVFDIDFKIFKPIEMCNVEALSEARVEVNGRSVTLRNYRLSDDPSVYGFVSECYQTLVNVNENININIDLKLTYPGDETLGEGSGSFVKSYSDGNKWEIFLPYRHDGNLIFTNLNGPNGAHKYVRIRD